LQRLFIKNDFPFFAPFLPRLALKFAKSAEMTQQIFVFFKKINIGLKKNANFKPSSMPTKKNLFL